MNEGVHPGARLRDHVAAQSGEIVGAGVAGGHHGRGCLVWNEFVGGNADRRAVGVNVGVQVDQPRCDQPAAGFEHAQRPLGGNTAFHGLDHAEADADVANAAQILAGIEHFAALDEEIELVVRPHRGLYGAGKEP